MAKTLTSAGSSSFFDAVYGSLELPGIISDLIRTPVVQRLRRVRLSNIDSLASPGISGVSRFEHALGTSHLAQHVGFWRQLSEQEQTILSSAALLHDIAITPYGHLLEEAFHYAGVHYSHEKKMAYLFEDTNPQELGGIDLQVYLGFESGISPWAERAFGFGYKDKLQSVFEALCGRGRFGPCISGGIDLDNIDNVVRLAHHMGIAPNLELPIQLAKCMVGVDAIGIVWGSRATSLVSDWLSVRARLYTHLMFAKTDFVGKAMLTTGIIEALANGQLGAPGHEWTMTDEELLYCMRSPDETKAYDLETARRVKDTVYAWESGYLWSVSPFWWVKGKIPSRKEIWEFRTVCSEVLGRECYAHAIPDKRHREVTLRYANGTEASLGSTSEQWLLGIVSPIGQDFSKKESERTIDIAGQYFSQDIVPLPADPIAEHDELSFFDWQ